MIYFNALDFNPLKTSPETQVYSGWGLWEMYVIAKSNRLQRVNECPSKEVISFFWRSVYIYENLQKHEL